MRAIRNFLHRIVQPFTLRKRILLIILLFSVAAASIIGTITYYTISSILENKLQTAIKSNLSQVKLAMENAISNLNHVSQLYSEKGSIGQELTAFNNAQAAYDRANLLDQITSGMNLIAFTNPSIGMCAYFPVDNELGYISNSRFKNVLPPQGLPLLAQYYLISYYGPHVSRDRMSNQIVISAIRKLNFPGSPDIYVYIETSFNLTQQILENDMLSEGISHLMLDNSGKVVYTENTDFPNGSTLDVSAADSGETAGYRWYKATSNQGWSMVSLISDADYNREKNRWLDQYLVFVVLFLLFSLFCGFLLWKTVYRPLRRFNDDIKVIEHGDLDTPPERIGIPEYDHIVDSLKSMKTQIKELISEVGRKEKLRADLEIEKLRLQINPHFLMNSLNTAHWLAITKNEPEIDKVIQSLNKLLSYNLGSTATLRDELAVLDEYMCLQQVRHNISYSVVNNVGEDALDVVLPRFILQPMIENSIRHGINEHPQITIELSMEVNRLLISVSDNGPGMEQETANRMLHEEEAQGLPKMGIGVSYVKRTIESYYGGGADLVVKSEKGQGMTFMLYIPLREAGH
jgi:two-component system sensor histidine kinase YesM